MPLHKYIFKARKPKNVIGTKRTLDIKAERFNIAAKNFGSSVVEPFHFGPAPAPASQDGGSGSSSSPVVHNLLMKKFFRKISLLNLPGLVLFTEMYECFALLFQYFTKRDRLI